MTKRPASKAKSRQQPTRLKKPTTTKSKPTPRARPKLGDNTLEGKAQPYLERVERLLKEIDSERGRFMSKCKELREDIREVLVEAKENADIPIKAMRAVVKWRELERKQADIENDFEDMDEKAKYEQLCDALGPLGFAAAQRAGFSANDDDGETTQSGASAAGNGAEAPRADEAQLANVGRGRDAPAADAPSTETGSETAH